MARKKAEKPKGNGGKGARRRGLFEEWQQPEKLTLLTGWRRDGLTFEQIAANIGVRRETLFKWSKKDENISNALKAGSEVMVYNTENELYESSKNRYVEELEITETALYDKQTGEKLQTVNRVTKKHRRYVPGNVAAQIFILKNRAANKWRERPDLMEQTEVTDDGFVDAMKASINEVWEDGEDSPGV